MAKTPDPAPPTPITRDDLERRFQALQDGVRRQVDDTQEHVHRPPPASAALLIVVIIFLLGRRSGKKKTTFVEIRRV